MNLRNWCTHKLPNGKLALEPTSDGFRCSICGGQFPKNPIIDEDVIANRAAEILQELRLIFGEVPDMSFPKPAAIADRHGSHRYYWYCESDLIDYFTMISELDSVEYNENNDDCERDRLIDEILLKYCNKIKIVATGLDFTNMPHVSHKFALSDANACPYKLDGICNNCENFVCAEIPKALLSEEEYCGYCIREEKRREMISNDDQ